MEEVKKRGRPKKEGEEATKPRLYRLTESQHLQVKAFIKTLKAKKA